MQRKNRCNHGSTAKRVQRRSRFNDKVGATAKVVVANEPSRFNNFEVNDRTWDRHSRGIRILWSCVWFPLEILACLCVQRELTLDEIATIPNTLKIDARRFFWQNNNLQPEAALWSR